MNASNNLNNENRAYLLTTDHAPVIRLAIDGHLIKPHIVRDIGGGISRLLSRHSSDLAARRAIMKFRRIAAHRK